MQTKPFSEMSLKELRQLKAEIEAAILARRIERMFAITKSIHTNNPIVIKLVMEFEAARMAAASDCYEHATAWVEETLDRLEIVLRLTDDD